MQLQCPCCNTVFPLEAGFLSGEAKQLAALCAGLEPALAKAALLYLRLFNSPKSALKLSKAIKLLEELEGLITKGTVTNDARTNDHKPASYNMWVTGIEQVIEQRDSLTLPLKNHNYLRAVVWGIACDPKQAALVSRSDSKKSTNKQAVHDTYTKLIGDLSLGLITQAQFDESLAILKKGG